MSNEVVYWIGTIDKCDVCKGSFSSPIRNDIMFDAAVTVPPNTRSVWGNVCVDCFLQFGKGIGQGYGQKYEKQRDGRWLKVAG